MSPRSNVGFFMLIVVFAAVVGATLWQQRLRTTSLRTELESTRAEVGELERLRAENVRLRSRQISAAQLEALRADHAALPQLRAQVEALSHRGPP